MSRDPSRTDFTAPIDRMRDAHRRVEGFLDRLVAAADAAVGGHVDDNVRAEIDLALRYLRSGTAMHHDDEEASLFPRLRVLVDEPRVVAALDVVEQLEEDHRAIAPLRARVEELASSLVGNEVVDAARAGELPALSRELREAYRRHIAIEERCVFDVADAVLDEATLQAIGEEMLARRGGTCAERREHAATSSRLPRP